MSSYRLYGYWRSSSSWRVRIALGIKGQSYETAAVHLIADGGQQRTAAHRRLNPLGQVPALEILDAAGNAQAVISESVAIMEYLEEVHPTPPLLPTEPLARAQVRQLVEVVNSGIQPLQNLSVLQDLESRFDAGKPEVQAWGADWITRGFTALEVLLSRWAGRHAHGDALTLADAVIVPQLYNARRFAVDLTPFPTLTRVEAAAKALPAFQAAAPERQPDAQ